MREQTQSNKAANNAGTNPSIIKPFTTVETNQIMKALMTKVKRPRVKIVTGRVKIKNKGRTRAFTRPRTKAAINAL